MKEQQVKELNANRGCVSLITSESDLNVSSICDGERKCFFGQ